MLSKEVSSTIFLSLWYDSTWDWTQVSQAFGKLYGAFIYNYLYWKLNILKFVVVDWLQIFECKYFVTKVHMV